MKKVLLLLTLFIPLIVSAGQVTEQEALQKAQQFFQGRSFQHGGSSQKRALSRATTLKNKTFYVFNADGDNGFVIVSADDRTLPILGYAENGNLDIDNLPSNIKVWLEGYSSQIQALGNASIKAPARKVIGHSVKPLITAHWDQDAPYNLLLDTGDDDGSHYVTGCVATALAQVMYYHKWPQAETASIPYHEGLPPTTFQWNLMKDDYYVDETGQSALAVAELMKYCGAAVDMSYGKDVSSATLTASPLIDYFKYSTSARQVWRRNYTTNQWEEIIYNELSNKRPVLYSGNSGSAIGHQFVVDGYDDDGLFHVNWGWGGYCDGFFALSILAPEDLGIGGGSSENGFTMIQDAMIGIQPPYEGQSEFAPLVWYQETRCTIWTGTRTSADQDFEFNLGSQLYNQEGKEYTIDHAWALYQGNQLVKILDVNEDTKLKTDLYVTYVSASVKFGAGITDGVYQVRQLYRMTHDGQWYPCAQYENSHITLSIHDNELTVIPSSQVKVNSCKIEGDSIAYQPMKITMNWTNNGYQNETEFKLVVSNPGNFPTTYEVSSWVDPGQTGDVVFYLTAPGPGEISFDITSGEQSLWSKSITVKELPVHELSADITYDGQFAGYCIEGTTINATVKIKNEGENDYDDIVWLILTRNVDDGDDEEIRSDTVHLILPVGQEKDLRFQFADLIADEHYGLQVWYKTADGNCDGNNSAGYTSCHTGQEKICDLTIHSYLDVEKVHDYQELVVIAGTTLRFKFSILASSNVDYYEDDIIIKLYEVTDTGQVFNQQVVIPVKIPTNIWNSSYSCEFTDLEEGKIYTIAPYYYFKGQEIPNESKTWDEWKYEIEKTRVTWTIDGEPSEVFQFSKEQQILTLRDDGNYAWYLPDPSYDHIKRGIYLTKGQTISFKIWAAYRRYHYGNEECFGDTVYTIPGTGFHNLTFCINPDTKQIQVEQEYSFVGLVGTEHWDEITYNWEEGHYNWGEDQEMTRNDDGTYTITIYNLTSNYQYQVIINHNYNQIFNYSGNNYEAYIYKPSDLTITFDPVSGLCSHQISSASGISLINADAHGADDVWYDLIGRKLEGKPVSKGVYIHNGRKTIIK